MKNVRNDLQAQLDAGRMVGSFDDNFDGKLQLAELRGPMAKMLQPQFAKLDRDGDGALSKVEMAASSSFAFARRRQAQAETPDL